ncbi:Major allergen Pru ar 1 [Morus notabilis]|uniref:Major allergen Pru ar 1 n=1 Tax=Morus notabilis TaxID=981085 RepID=W9RL38_9ROSA|nr:major allergen Pru ar 1 [Morus notabilis]EXB95730.1 Major allergen Pru ar 1 [Morus notabilis]
MGVTSFMQEFSSPVPPHILFKAVILDIHNLVHKVMPQAIESIDIVQGNGGPGTIKQINFAKGTRYKYMRHRIDSLDVENFRCKYTLTEGDVLTEKIEYISYEVEFEKASEGGCVCKMRSEYHIAQDFEIDEEEIRIGKERAIGMYRVVEAYLFENPGAYDQENDESMFLIN